VSVFVKFYNAIGFMEIILSSIGLDTMLSDVIFEFLLNILITLIRTQGTRVSVSLKLDLFTKLQHIVSSITLFTGSTYQKSEL